MDLALARLSEALQQELCSRLEPLLRQVVADSLEVCRQVCKQQFEEFRHQQSQLPDTADPVLVAVTQGKGPTGEEAARQAAKLLVSAAILNSATGGSTGAPAKAAPVSPAPQPKVTAAPKPVAKPKQSPAPKPKPQEVRKSITEQVMGSMTGLLGKTSPKAAKAKAMPDALQAPGPGMLSYIRKSLSGPPAKAQAPPAAAAKAKAESKKSPPKIQPVLKAPVKPKPPQAQGPAETKPLPQAADAPAETETGAGAATTQDDVQELETY